MPDFEGYESLWLDSGTSALAIGLLIAKSQEAGIKQPEAIIPAYGCPDLVAACVFAGVKPRLVDIQADDPGYDLSALGAACNDNTLAVLAVNFLGIRERLAEIRALIPPHTWLLEDNAQWFPELDAHTALTGDLIATSFGRGKPASILGGGLLLLRKDRLGSKQFDAIIEEFPVNTDTPATRRLKISLYNLLLHPRLYFWLSRNPLLKLGETHYDGLESVARLSPSLIPLIGANAEQWCHKPRTLESRFDAIAQSLGLDSLAVRLLPRRKRLLRYPLLFSTRERRDTMRDILHREGLGASLMYQQPMLSMSGVAADVIAESDYPGATQFASRLLTLPLHRGVGERHLDAIEKVLADSEL